MRLRLHLRWHVSNATVLPGFLVFDLEDEDEDEDDYPLENSVRSEGEEDHESSM